MLKLIRNFLVLFSAIAPSMVHADLIFSAPPHRAASLTSAYTALADKMSTVLGEKVVFEPPANWADYSVKMRGGKYDIVLDGPHFASWRINRLQHKAVARLPGSLQFHTLAIDEHTHSDLQDIAHHRVCSFPSPHLAAVSLLSVFTVTVPEIVDVNGDGEAMFKAFRAGRCDAVTLLDAVHDKIPESERKDLKIMHTSPAYPNQVLTAGPRVNDTKIEALRNFVLGHDAGIKPLLGALDSTADAMVMVKPDELKNYSKLLEGMVWGW